MLKVESEKWKVEWFQTGSFSKKIKINKLSAAKLLKCTPVVDNYD